MNVRSERINDYAHQSGHRGDDRRQEVHEARRLIGNNVFFENEFDQIGERLQKTTGPNSIRSQTALNKTEHASFGQHGVSHHRHHHSEGDQDAR